AGHVAKHSIQETSMIRQPSINFTTIGLLALAFSATPARAQDDHGDTCGTATPITTDGTIVGAIIDPVTDEDWLSFNAIGGQRYEATTLVVSASFIDIIQVIGPDCTTLLTDWGYWSPDDRSFVTPTTGTYYVRILSYPGGNVGYVELGLTDR